MASKQEMAGGSTRILLLTQDHCGFCEQAQDILNRLAREYQLSISTLDMQSPEGQKLAMQGGFLFPPGVLIENEPFSYGRLSERKLRGELDRRLRSREKHFSLL
jgi:glutaredoxin